MTKIKTKQIQDTKKHVSAQDCALIFVFKSKYYKA